MFIDKSNAYYLTSNNRLYINKIDRLRSVYLKKVGYLKTDTFVLNIFSLLNTKLPDTVKNPRLLEIRPVRIFCFKSIPCPSC